MQLPNMAWLHDSTDHLLCVQRGPSVHSFSDFSCSKMKPQNFAQDLEGDGMENDLCAPSGGWHHGALPGVANRHLSLSLFSHIVGRIQMNIIC